ncbi:MAG: hypothetical protein M1608_14045 [Candidatus Omnitrophica bacterium]|nr:hypothetical protein [Candidatus Omnitrophota bacterium]
MNLLERQLRRWTPRQPSPRLKARLFPPGSPNKARFQIGLSWLVPVAGLLLLIALGPGQGNFSSTNGTTTGFHHLYANLAVSNGAWIPAGLTRGARERNVLPDAVFEWTNSQRSASSTDFFLLLNTNNIR